MADAHPPGRRLVAVGLSLLVLFPLFRVVEGLVRLIFLSGHYGSFKDAVFDDIWFSDGWWAYVRSPPGLAMSILAVCWILAGALLAWLGIRRARQL